MSRRQIMCIIIVVLILNTFLLPVYQYIKGGDKVRPHRSVVFKLFNLATDEQQIIENTHSPTSSRLEGENNSQMEYLSNLPMNKILITKLIMKTADTYTNLYEKRILGSKCNKCAVVTSSGRLVNQSAGTKIDQSDCVIRMNNAPVAGYEQDVGTRTDIRIVGNVNAKFLKKDSKSIFQGTPTNTLDRRKHIVVMTWLYNDTVNDNGSEIMTAKDLSKQFPNFDFYFPTAQAISSVENIFQLETGIQRSKLKKWFTTGWQTMLLSLSMCNEIHVYGMPQYELCSKSDSTLYHYYDKNGHKECDYYKKSEINPNTGHLFITEKAIFARWAKRYNNIIFHYPTWNLSLVADDVKLNSPFIHEMDLRKLREVLRLKEQDTKPHYKVPKEPLYFVIFTASLLFILIQIIKFGKLIVQMFDIQNTTW